MQEEEGDDGQRTMRRARNRRRNSVPVMQEEEGEDGQRTMRRARNRRRDSVPGMQEEEGDKPWYDPKNDHLWTPMWPIPRPKTKLKLPCSFVVKYRPLRVYLEPHMESIWYPDRLVQIGTLLSAAEIKQDDNFVDGKPMYWIR